MNEVFDPSIMTAGSWYIVYGNNKPRTLQFDGTEGKGHFKTPNRFDYWCDPTKIHSGPYPSMRDAQAAWAKPELRNYGGSI